MKFPAPGFLARTSILVASASLLTSCFMLPGKFDSEMEISTDGSFSYSYDGEIHLLGMSKLAQMSKEFGGSAAVEMDAPCYSYSWERDDAADAVEEAADAAADMAAEGAEETVEVADIDIDEPQERECTEAELTDRRESAERAKERNERQAKQMSALFGGIDLTDPNAGDEIAAKLTRQKGWDKVEHLGDGKFDVEFELTSTMGHDFAFPMMEGMPAAQPFVYAYRRNSAVRIDAPGFALGQTMNSPGPMMGGVNLLTFALRVDDKNDENAEALEAFADIGGSFTLITNGEVLANNTDEGFERLPDGRRKMVWPIDSSTKEAPMALIGM